MGLCGAYLQEGTRPVFRGRCGLLGLCAGAMFVDPALYFGSYIWAPVTDTTDKPGPGRSRNVALRVSAVGHKKERESLRAEKETTEKV